MDYQNPDQPDKSASNARRRLLRNRRASVTGCIQHGGTDITVTVGQYPGGAIGEIFINAGHANSAIDAIVSDAAIAVSFALQHGADIAAIRSAMKRNSQGEPSSPIGAALDWVVTP